MPMSEKYCYLTLRPAENGYVLSYEEKIKNPMEKDGPYCDAMRYESKTEVFSIGNGKDIKSALNEAVKRFAELHEANLGGY